MPGSCFIVFEGGEGSGKSTQAKVLANRLRRLGFGVVLTHEPGGTLLGNKLRRWLKWGRGVTTQSELFLFLASRSQLVSKVIRPALDRGQIVICDRFEASTFAYQGYGRGMDLAFLENLNGFVTDGLQPDLIVLLDLDAERGLERKRMRLDCFEREEFAFHRRVREGYLRMAASDSNRWLVIDGSLPQEQIGDIIWEKVSQFVG
ncbi:MAG: dTMP kinase [Chloroflexi bacterium]|nr:dTMP kinase [Chloroflexota bacterium]